MEKEIKENIKLAIKNLESLLPALQKFEAEVEYGKLDNLDEKQLMYIANKADSYRSTTVSLVHYDICLNKDRLYDGSDTEWIGDKGFERKLLISKDKQKEKVVMIANDKNKSQKKKKINTTQGNMFN